MILWLWKSVGSCWTPLSLLFTRLNKPSLSLQDLSCCTFTLLLTFHWIFSSFSKKKTWKAWELHQWSKARISAFLRIWSWNTQASHHSAESPCCDTTSLISKCLPGIQESVSGSQMYQEAFRQLNTGGNLGTLEQNFLFHYALCLTPWCSSIPVKLLKSYGLLQEKGVGWRKELLRGLTHARALNYSIVLPCKADMEKNREQTDLNSKSLKTSPVVERLWHRNLTVGHLKEGDLGKETWAYWLVVHNNLLDITRSITCCWDLKLPNIGKIFSIVFNSFAMSRKLSHPSES